MRTAAWEAVPPIALKDHSQEAVGEAQYIRFCRRWSSIQLSTHFTKAIQPVSVVIRKGFSAFLDMMRCKQLLTISTPEGVQGGVKYSELQI